MKQRQICGLTMVCAVSAGLLLATAASAQVGLVRNVGPTFSVDFQGPISGFPGPINGIPDSWHGIRMDEGTILSPFRPGPPGPNPPTPGPGPLTVPGHMVSSVPVPVGPIPNHGTLGIRPGLTDAVEVDALSYGRDAVPGRNADTAGGKLLSLHFSVDEWALGDQVAGPLPGAPNVFTESGWLGGVGPMEAATDIFAYRGVMAPTPPGPGPYPSNVGIIDGNAVDPFGRPGLGLFEPTFPTPGQLNEEGDNLDAYDSNTRLTQFHLRGPDATGGPPVIAPIFFSMDSRFADPLEGGSPFNSGTAPGNSDPNTGTAFSGADVVVTTNPAGAPVPGLPVPVLYAPALRLGLDQEAFDSDDLDALALWDDGARNTLGNPFFDPDRDRILFSVRRGSAVVGMLDSAFGLRISEGDILTVPTAAGGTPAIYIPAEYLGLATIRSGTFNDRHIWNDDLDAMDVFTTRCDLDRDGDCDVQDINTLYSAGDLTPPGVAPTQTTVDYDLNIDFTIDVSDLKVWLSIAAITNGFATPYRQGDTELDRDVDITDFNTLAGNFDPGGLNGFGNTWDKGNFNGDFDIDIGDFNDLASNFAPGGYDDASAAVTADADPGQVDLVVDLATGEVVLDGNNAAISGLQVFSAGNSLLATDFTADVLQFVISTNTSTYAEGAFANTGVDGLISLGIMYDLLVNAQDLTFEYTMIGQPTVQGRVAYIPEPASLLLLGMGGLMIIRRRRAA